MLEAALTLPLLIFMACGTMDLARVFFAGIVVESAARAGVQFGSFSVGRSGAFQDMKAAAETDSSGQGLSGIVVTSRGFCGCNADTTEVSCTAGTCSGRLPSGYVETSASYTFNPIIPYPGIPRNIPISAVARFRAQ